MGSKKESDTPGVEGLLGEIKDHDSKDSQRGPSKKGSITGLRIGPEDLVSSNPFLSKEGQIRRARGIIEEFTRANQALLELDRAIAEVGDAATIKETDANIRKADLQDSETQILLRQLEHERVLNEIAKEQAAREKIGKEDSAPKPKPRKAPKDNRSYPQRVAALKHNYETTVQKLRDLGFEEGDPVFDFAKHEYEDGLRRLRENFRRSRWKS